MLSGFRPTGNLHLGNMIGSLLPAIDADSTILIADFHAINTSNNASELRSNIEASTRLIEALIRMRGSKSQMVLQSRTAAPQISVLVQDLVPESIILQGHTAKTRRESSQLVNGSHLNYPILMAADILASGETEVAVGADQKQAIELTNFIIGKLNRLAKDNNAFRSISGIGINLPVLIGTDGRKMSKSYSNTLPIFLPVEQRPLLAKIVRSIPTSSVLLGTPMEHDYLFSIGSIIMLPEEKQQLVSVYERGEGHGKAKQLIYDAYEAFMNRIGNHMSANIPLFTDNHYYEKSRQIYGKIAHIRGIQ